MKKTFYYNFFPTKAEEDEAKASNTSHQINRVIVEIRDLYPSPAVDPLNPWQIRKVLRSNDVVSGKLTLSHQETFEHVFRYWNVEMANHVERGKKVSVLMWDVTESNNPVRYRNENTLFEKGPNESYMLGWKDMVRERHLNPSDEVGLFWEYTSGAFQIKLLHRGV